MHGKFQQTLVVDFGTKPVLCIPVSIATKLDMEVTLNESLLTLSQSWDDSNCNISKIENSNPHLDNSNADKELMKKYRYVYMYYTLTQSLHIFEKNHKTS